MLIVFRWWYFAGVLGLALLIYGGSEARLALQSTSEPVAISFADLEKNDLGAMRHVRLGQHVALEALGVSLTRGSRETVEKVAYPLLAIDDPYLQRVAALDPSKEQKVPDLNDAHVIAVRSVVSDNGELRDTFETVDAVEGVLFDYAALDLDERKLVDALAPQVAHGRVRIIEIGRHPKPLALAIAIAIVGLASLGLAIRLFRGPRPKKPVEPSTPESPSGPETPAKQDLPYLHEGLDSRRPEP